MKDSSQGGKISVLWVNDALSIQGTYYKSEAEMLGSYLGDKLYEDSLNYRIPGISHGREIDIISLSTSTTSLTLRRSSLWLPIWNERVTEWESSLGELLRFTTGLYNSILSAADR